MRDDAYGCHMTAEGAPICEDAHLGWLSRVIVLSPERLLLCGVEKNGIALLNQLAARVRGQRFAWFSYNPWRSGIPPDPDALWHWRSPDWRRVVVLREPMERFFSAWASKCGPHRDHDGDRNCEQVFQLTHRDNATVNTVASRLQPYGLVNAHWAPQVHAL